MLVIYHLGSYANALLSMFFRNEKATIAQFAAGFHF